MKLRAQVRECKLEERSVNEEERTISFSFSSREPIKKWFGTEILSHDPGAIVTRRLDGGSVPFLLDHNRSKPVGKVTSYQVTNNRMSATAKLSRNPAAEELLRDIVDGIRDNISVGYIPHEMKMIERNDDNETYLITKWEPLEVSSVSVPADPTVGIGRDAAEEYEVRVLDPSEVRDGLPVFIDKRTKPMPENVETPKPQIEVNEQQMVDVRTAERTRIRDLTLIGKRFGAEKEAEDFISAGKTIADFRAFILDEKLKEASRTIIGPNEIGMNQKEVRRYSLCKAIREGKEGLSGLEREASQAVTKLLGREPSGFFVPDIALTRDLSAGVAAAGGVTIQLTVEPTLIQYLRNKTVIGAAGATMMGGLTSNVSLPRQTGPGTAYWLAENAQVTRSAQTFDQVGLSPKRLAALTAYSKQLVSQSSLDVENIVRDDLLQVIAVAQDAAAFYGTGIINNQPAGILSYAANLPAANPPDYTKRSPDVTFGGAATWLSVVQFEGHVENNNVGLDNTCAYITSPLVKSSWKTTPKAVNFPVFLWERGDVGQNGEVNGYRAFATKQINNNVVVFGKWSDCIVATWSGLDMITDPYSLADTFQIRVIVNLLTDIQFRYVLSFCASTDAGNQ